ncbi:trimeric intracellular cation channel family protein [Vibrio sinensis]|uniref:Trimeric intracellular cation channel family protein n=1 Tax=Vibrio sinensis TaxID=2302434 RepID=A0A3A6R1G0_9VIBR|nr:TRIC cation channel family protein [Vibrio sinensis]RJX75134.1 trimeric intracellular cation channel family protein [Vibrio sinensis]
MSVIYFFDIFGTIIFAICGVIVASKFGMDAFGAIVLGGLTAIGGGTFRDMALGATPVFWMNDTTYLWVILVTCLITMIMFQKLDNIPSWILPVSDAIGLAVFVGIGFEKAIQYQDSMMVAIVMGVITGCGGGIIRDALTSQVSNVLKREIYATACLIGGIVYSIALSMGVDNTIAFMHCVITTLIVRLAAIHLNLSLPTLSTKDKC